MASHQWDEETELEVIDVVEADGYQERSVSMVIPRDEALPKMTPLEEVDDLTDEDGVELVDDELREEVDVIELTELENEATTPTPHERPAVSTVQRRPPNVDKDEHPFHTYPAASDALEAWRRLRMFESWQGLEAEVQAKLGVSRAMIARARLRILSDMLHYGLAATEPTLELALDVGLAPSRSSLVTTLRQRFEATMESPASAGLSKTQVRANWTALEALSSGRAASS